MQHHWHWYMFSIFYVRTHVLYPVLSDNSLAMDWQPGVFELDRTSSKRSISLLVTFLPASVDSNVVVLRKLRLQIVTAGKFSSIFFRPLPPLNLRMQVRSGISMIKQRGKPEEAIWSPPLIFFPIQALADHRLVGPAITPYGLPPLLFY